jgi:hypothetical protein
MKVVNFEISWSVNGLMFQVEKIVEFFRECNIKLKTLHTNTIGSTEALGLNWNDIKFGEISRLEFGGNSNPHFTSWLKKCAASIPQRDEYFIFFMTCQVYFILR